MKTIPLTKGKVAKISPEDDDLSKGKWFVCGGYATTQCGGRFMLQAVIAQRMGLVGRIDFRNRDKFDYRRENLRVATPQQDTQTARG